MYDSLNSANMIQYDITVDIVIIMVCTGVMKEDIQILPEELRILSEYICIGCDVALDDIINGCGFTPRPCSKNSRMIKIFNCLEKHKIGDNDNNFNKNIT